MTQLFGLYPREKQIALKVEITRGEAMRKHYDFSQMQGVKNPYVKRLKQPITIRLDKDTIAYFKSLASEIGMPYQNVINLYLRECAREEKKPSLKWAS